MQANTNDFALLPDNGPARLLRFGTLPHPTMVSLLDPKRNILRISPSQYERLTEAQRNLVDITHEVALGVEEDNQGNVLRLVPWKEPERNYPEPLTHCH